MSTLIDTIERGLANIGREPLSILIRTLDAFDELRLPDQARVSAIATALLETAGRHHARHSAAFLTAVRTWALEAARRVPTDHGRRVIEMWIATNAVGDAASALASGADQLVTALQLNGTPLEDRVVAELTLFTRLLSAHDERTIVSLMEEVGQAFAAGRRRTRSRHAALPILSVQLNPSAPLDRQVDLATIPVCGVA